MPKYNVYTVYNHFTGEVFQSHCITRNRAKNNALNMAKCFAKDIDEPMRYFFSRSECHIIPLNVTIENHYMYFTDFYGDIRRYNKKDGKNEKISGRAKYAE